MKQVIRNGRFVFPDRIAEDVGLVLDGGTVEAVLPVGRLPAGCPVLDAGGCLVAPGFVDVHVHGGGGYLFSDATPEAIETACRTHLRHGTTTLLPTLEACETERTLAALRALVEFARTHELGPMIAGINLEGPFLNPAKAGAQPVAHIRAPDPALTRQLLDAGDGLVKVMTISPELSGAEAVIRLLVERGVVAAIGHSTASAELTTRAVEWGARLVTHVFSAMSGLHHREPGMAGVALDDGRLWCELTCDGIHVAPLAMRLVVKLKGVERVVLITDAIACLEAASEMKLFGHTVTVRDGAARLPDGTLAGSVLTMERAVRNVAAAAANLDVPSAVRMATLTPAELLGEASRIGRLDRPGARANAVFLADDGSVIRTILDGKTVWEAAGAV